MKPSVQEENQHPFATLTPSYVMDAVESQGLVCDGRLFPLNSYENRVYQVGIEDQEPLIAKFYRPARWSDAQILEEHHFCYELVEHELPVVAPVADSSGQSLFEFDNFRFSLFPRRGGHAPELDNLSCLFTLGRCMGRLHLVGASRPFQHRPTLDKKTFGHDSIELISEGFIPAELKTSYVTLTRDIMSIIDETLDRQDGINYIRVHGDCHSGNILWRNDAPHFVDFDDTRMAPAIQDIWMLLSGDRAMRTAQLSDIVEGYSDFFDFHARELQLVEVFRTLRMLHFSAWLARRWTDPAFPRSFPWFNTMRYWSDHVLELREQFAALNEPPLEVV